MDANDVAAQQQMGAIAAQHTLIGMSDRPEQFREPPLSALFRQAWRERYGQRGRELYDLSVLVRHDDERGRTETQDSLGQTLW